MRVNLRVIRGGASGVFLGRAPRPAQERVSSRVAAGAFARHFPAGARPASPLEPDVLVRGLSTPSVLEH